MPCGVAQSRITEDGTIESALVALAGEKGRLESAAAKKTANAALADKGAEEGISDE